MKITYTEYRNPKAKDGTIANLYYKKENDGIYYMDNQIDKLDSRIDSLVEYNIKLTEILASKGILNTDDLSNLFDVSVISFENEE